MHATTLDGASSIVSVDANVYTYKHWFVISIRVKYSAPDSVF